MSDSRALYFDLDRKCQALWDVKVSEFSIWCTIIWYSAYLSHKAPVGCWIPAAPEVFPAPRPRP